MASIERTAPLEHDTPMPVLRIRSTTPASAPASLRYDVPPEVLDGSMLRPLSWALFDRPSAKELTDRPAGQPQDRPREA